jgi:hypothetical protein
MTVCVLYCNEPPEDVDTCSARSPTTIVVPEGASKVVCGKIFFSSCNKPNPYGSQYLPIANITVANTTLVDYSNEEISYSLDYYDKNIASGTTMLSYSGLFKITLPVLENTKYCYLTITHRDGKCIFPVVVCS